MPLIARRQFFPVWSAGLALLHAALGRTAAAVDRIEGLVGAFDSFPPHGWAVPTSALLAEAIDLLPDAGHRDLRRRVAQRVSGQLEPWADELVLAGWPTVLLGPANRFLAVLALATGDPEEAEARAAAGLAAVVGSPHQMAWMRVYRARALTVLGGGSRRAEAAELLAAARTHAQHPSLRALRDLIDRCP